MPPDNGGYMVAAYAVTAVILLGYAVMLVRRARRAIERAGTLRTEEGPLPGG